LALSKWDSDFFFQDVDICMSVFINWFLDLCHIFIHYTHRLASWMLSIVNWYNSSFELGNPVSCFESCSLLPLWKQPLLTSCRFL
jgi:hypothetical protein